jgi:hypothetical protein
MLINRTLPCSCVNTSTVSFFYVSYYLASIQGAPTVTSCTPLPPKKKLVPATSRLTYLETFKLTNAIARLINQTRPRCEDFPDTRARRERCAPHCTSRLHRNVRSEAPAYRCRLFSFDLITATITASGNSSSKPPREHFPQALRCSGREGPTCLQRRRRRTSAPSTCLATRRRPQRRWMCACTMVSASTAV